MPDYLRDCMDSVRGKLEISSPKEFMEVMCRRCRQPECTHAGWSKDLFSLRVEHQADRLLNPVQADPRLPRYARITGVDFKDMLHQAIRLEISERRGDWTPPDEIDISDGVAELAGVKVTGSVDEAIRKMAEAQGKEPPILPDPAEAEQVRFQGETEEIMAEVDRETPAPPKPLVLHCPECQVHHVDRDAWATRPHKTHLCENCHHEWQPFPYPTVGVQAPSAPSSPPSVPFGNTPVPDGGVMLGGPLPPPVDPWEPPKKKGEVVQVGARVSMGDKSND